MLDSQAAGIERSQPTKQKENEMERKVEWQTKAGKTATVTVRLVTEKTVDLDGDKCSVSCCEIEIIAEVEGAGCVGTGKPWTRKGLPAGAVAAIGKLCVDAGTLARINSAIAEVEADPRWVAKQAVIAANRKAIEELDVRRARDGLCPHCHTYCYGDCRAN